jgi:hypothetical protein
MKVVCIDPWLSEFALTYNKVYDVEYGGANTLCVINDYGRSCNYNIGRFKLLSQVREETINKILDEV